jgi:hypothetical protein
VSPDRRRFLAAVDRVFLGCQGYTRGIHTTKKLDRNTRRKPDLLVVHLIGRVDTRLIILTGLGLTAVSLWQMTGFSLQMLQRLLCRISRVPRSSEAGEAGLHY